MGKELLELSEKSPRQIVDELFENEQVKTLMLYAACHWGLGPEEEGLGFLVPLYLDRATHYCRSSRWFRPRAPTDFSNGIFARDGE